MADRANTINYGKLRILVADDFSNFRATVTSMLTKLGVGKVDVASSGDGAIEACQRGVYDAILCDYDLGVGKNGQQVLEELRHRRIINDLTLFIIISADAAKDVVMAAYDCEPNDYLMKPITAKMLEQRMGRLLELRAKLLPAHKALASGDSDKATQILIDLSLTEGRQAIAAQKMLGELFIEREELSKAEKLYSKALELRQLDWAQLGLARVKRLRGEIDVATESLERLVAGNPLYLPAYDELANNWENKGQSLELQQAVQKSVSISPKSILRQKRLAQVAELNGDFHTAIAALRCAVRLGERSCLASPDDNLNFARVAASTIEKKLDEPEPLSSEAIDVVEKARNRFSLTQDQLTRASLLEGRVRVLSGDEAHGRSIIDAVEKHNRADESIEARIERIRAMQTLGDKDAAEALIQALLNEFPYDQGVLQRLDALLEEPVSESNRTLVANINREGIDLYNRGQFDQAIDCFAKARRLFPKHVGIQLNIVQAYVGKLKAGETNENTITQTLAALEQVSEQLDKSHAHYDRFTRLQGMASACITNQ